MREREREREGKEKDRKRKREKKRENEKEKERKKYREEKDKEKTEEERERRRDVVVDNCRRLVDTLHLSVYSAYRGSGLGCLFSGGLDLESIEGEKLCATFMSPLQFNHQMRK